MGSEASPTRLSGMLLIPPVPYCLGPSKWRPLGDPHPGPVQGLRRLLEQAEESWGAAALAASEPHQGGAEVGPAFWAAELPALGAAVYALPSAILAWEAGVAPLATVNIWMSLCQLQCLPFRVLHFVFSPGFMNRISVVELELPGYQGPHLPQRQQVPIFPQPLITDRVHCKYSHKDIVAEGLWQLLGEVPPGPDCASRLLYR
ncbi:fas-activated serine/threonine kinase isoform X2 [Cavia porcellus]|uniref:fas-activated serine/threonine kinase isoform X2 n=1 Tax=Cavia porcellus TaxID=10141 RepID=UPI002FE01A59